MSSEDILLAAVSPFIRDFIYMIIRSIQNKRIYSEDKVLIDSDLVPRFSERIFRSSLVKKEISLPDIPAHSESKIHSEDHGLSPTAQSNRNPSFNLSLSHLPSPSSPPIPHQIPQQNFPQKVLPPIESYNSQKRSTTLDVPPQQKFVPPLKGYGRIDSLLYDPSISIIECPGPNKPLAIMRVGQRQFTKISLSPQEIKWLLSKISERAHIPLLEGVFRAAVDNFSINAIISEMVGSKFVIKKNVPIVPPKRYA